MSDTFPRLLGDVGGTNARLGWQTSLDSGVQHVQVLPCADFPTLEVAIQTYLKHQKLPAPRACAIGIANPIKGDTVRMTNHHWTFSISEMARNLGVSKLNVINDFTALALAIPSISQDQLIQIGGKHASGLGPKAIIGAGTGLGSLVCFPSKQASINGWPLQVKGVTPHWLRRPKRNTVSLN
jgi:glucokinase